jgi:hypothetical protein
MSTTKYTCPPQTASGQGTFSDNLVGFQIVDGGGLTQGNFEFTRTVVEKNNRSFESGQFSEKVSLDTLDIKDVEQSVSIQEVNFKVYPNFDQTVVTNFVNYGPLTKRFSAAVERIVNYFPAALEVDKTRYNLTTGTTAFNISYNSSDDITSFSISVSAIKNPFGVDFSKKSTENIGSLDFEVSEFRNLTKNFVDFVLDYSGETYQIVQLTPTISLSSGTLTMSCQGRPFSSNTTTTDSLIIRPNNTIVSKVFNLDLDEIEELLLNRISVPKYTALFKVPSLADDGNLYYRNQLVTWKLDGQWNLDIRTQNFTNYLQLLNNIGKEFDEFQTNLISRFYITDAFQEFDTDDGKVDKVLKLYGRSFDETKKFIDGISFMNSVNYNIGNDVPSKLIPNFAKTIGWNTDISPITNQGFIESLYGVSESNFEGQTFGLTVEELNTQYYRNLILNSAYLYKSKGTRKAIDFILQYIGAPEALIDFNENIYLADSNISKSTFNSNFSQISGGTYFNELPQLDPNNVYSFLGTTYTAYTSSTIIEDVNFFEEDYPIDQDGFPKAPTDTDDYYFQKGAGWYQPTIEHTSPEIINTTGSVFTGQNIDVQTQLEPFTYGQKYLDRFRDFPYLDLGYSILRVQDNKKSWADTNEELRLSNSGGFNSIYETYDDRLVLNVKNAEICLNPGQAITYDIWYLSRTENYPIPYSGLSLFYPKTDTYGVDATFIDPKPQVQNFYQFNETFWKTMINVRNRQYSSDGKTSGYPTLQSIFWTYLTMYDDVGINNNNFNYQNMIEYVNGIGTYWVELVSQFVPATTLWNSGTKLENSPFHRQKFIYRRQAGCTSSSEYVAPPTVGAALFFPFGTNKSVNPPDGGGGGGGDIVDPPPGCEYEQKEIVSINCQNDFQLAYLNFYDTSSATAFEDIGCRNGIIIRSWGYILFFKIIDGNGNEYEYRSTTYDIFVNKSDGSPYTPDDINTDTPLYVECDYLADVLQENLLSTMNTFFGEYGYEVSSTYDVETGELSYTFITAQCIDFTVVSKIVVKGGYNCA